MTHHIPSLHVLKEAELGIATPLNLNLILPQLLLCLLNSYPVGHHHLLRSVALLVHLTCHTGLFHSHVPILLSVTKVIVSIL